MLAFGLNAENSKRIGLVLGVVLFILIILFLDLGVEKPNIKLTLAIAVLMSV